MQASDIEDVDLIATQLVERLHDDIARESVVAFIGAGSTTERDPRRSSFYRLIQNKAAYPDSLPPLSFPELMEYYCEKLDGGHHNRLIREAISYLELFFLPGDERRSATTAVKILAQIPYFTRIVTTNWDPLIERSIDILVPVIEDRDLAFWDDQKRQVLKIHGCITRPYSLVATTTDYQSCISANPLIFNKLQDLMATQTFLFMGYSLRDPDFQQIWDTITKPLGKFAKSAYTIDPNATDESIAYWRQRGVQIFRTYDQIFLGKLRERLEKEDFIPSQDLIDALRRERERIVSTHLQMNQDCDGGLASSMYQDGLIHMLDDVLSSSVLAIRRRQDFESELALASRKIRESLAQDDPIEVAYWSGRHEVLKRFCDRDTTQIPRYFHPDKLVPIVRYAQGTVWSDSVVGGPPTT